MKCVNFSKKGLKPNSSKLIPTMSYLIRYSVSTAYKKYISVILSASSDKFLVDQIVREIYILTKLLGEY